jgi:anhydro-N-acetylmuramic acid kinase
LIVAGIMSGTSVDGIDVALVRISGRGVRTKPKLLSHAHYPLPAAVRGAILEAINSGAEIADLARLNFLLGELYAEAVVKTQRSTGLTCELIGCHGQTIYHQGQPARYINRELAVTWQLGEGAIIAAKCGVPVVSDFRPADMAAGGKGAPLVPFLDYLYFRHPKRGRIIQNLGGIGNLTAIPPGAVPEDVIAFDTGPADMVIDAVTEELFGRPFDKDGRIAARGTPITSVVAEILRFPFFRRHPPRTAGREEFGRNFVTQFIRSCGRAQKEDVVATATLLTACSIREALIFVARTGRPRHSRPEPGGTLEAFHDFIVSGGGARNATLMRMIAAELQPFGLQIHTSDEFGLPAQAKEAVAFALLAYQTWHRQPGNLRSATGARHPAILGKISYP